VLNKTHSEIKKNISNKIVDDKKNENIQTLSNKKLDSSKINQTATTEILDTTAKETNQSATVSHKKNINKQIERTYSSESFDDD